MNLKEIKKEIEKKENELNILKEQLNNAKEYEGFIILTPKTTIKKLDTIKKEIIKIIDNENLKIIEDLGLKKLAYEIQKQKEGYYLRFEFIAQLETITELERFFRLENSILKFLTIKMED